MSTDFTTLEKLYARGVLDINGKDYINGTSSNISINSNRDTFLPDNRFYNVDGGYIRQQIDRDIFTSSSMAVDGREIYNSTTNPSVESNSKKIYEKLKKYLLNDVTAGIVGVGALLLSGRYILKKLRILK